MFRMNTLNKNVLLTILVFCSLTLKAEIKLPALVADHMVLQRNIPIPVWGWADPGEQITITFNDKTYKTTTNANGKWQLKMDKFEAGGPFKLMIKGRSQEIVVNDILIGDVWLCSGQSNMGYDFNQPRAKVFYAQEIAASANDKIRQILISHVTSPVPLEDCKTTGWKSTRPETINGFSIVAWFFAKNIFEKYQVPIGLINSSWGGTRAEAWMSEDGLKAFPEFNSDIALLKDTAMIALKTKERLKSINDWHRQNRTDDQGYQNNTAVWAQTDLNDSDWNTVSMPALLDKIGEKNIFGAIWFRKDINLSLPINDKVIIKLSIAADEAEVFINGIKAGGFTNGKIIREYPIPATLFKEGNNIITVRLGNWNGGAGFADKLPFELDLGTQNIALAGNWKYKVGRKTTQLLTIYKPQGLATSIYNAMVAPLLPYAITGTIWYQGENNEEKAYQYQTLFPALIANWRFERDQGDFPFIFEQLVNFRDAKSQPDESIWAELREAQLLTLKKARNTAMAVGIELGEADNIHPVDKGGVGYRLSLAARKEAYGETKLNASGPIYRSMRILGDKIEVDFTKRNDTLIAKNGALKYFAIAGNDRVFQWAKAIIKGGKIQVWNDDIQNPVAVRYAWADNPVGCNLYNAAGLPASPFRTDDWPGLTYPKPADKN
jgi:sialate O-acetylesterase